MYEKMISFICISAIIAMIFTLIALYFFSWPVIWASVIIDYTILILLIIGYITE
jgi:hypothetical protein